MDEIDQIHVVGVRGGLALLFEDLEANLFHGHLDLFEGQLNANAVARIVEVFREGFTGLAMSRRTGNILASDRAEDHS